MLSPHYKQDALIYGSAGEGTDFLWFSTKTCQLSKMLILNRDLTQDNTGMVLRLVAKKAPTWKGGEELMGRSRHARTVRELL